MNLSYWERNSYFENCDIVIIGSGIVGLNAALELKRRDKKLNILILERGMLPMGASSKNAGFACFGSVSELIADLDNHSEEEVFSLVEKRWKGLKRLRKNLGDDTLDFHNYGGYEVFDSNMEFDKCEDKINYLNLNLSAIIGKKNVFKNASSEIKKFGFRKVKHMIVNTSESQLDTGKHSGCLDAVVRGVGSGRESAIRAFIAKGVEIQSIKDKTPVPHNGPRARKPRRI